MTCNTLNLLKKVSSLYSELKINKECVWTDFIGGVEYFNFNVVILLKRESKKLILKNNLFLISSFSQTERAWRHLCTAPDHHNSLLHNMQSRLRYKKSYLRNLWMKFSITLVSFIDIHETLHTKQKFLLSHLRHSDIQKIKKFLIQISRVNQIDQDASTRNTWMGSQRSVDRHHPRRRWVRGRRCSGSRYPDLDGNPGCKQSYRQVDSHLVPHYGLQVLKTYYNDLHFHMKV